VAFQLPIKSLPSFQKLFDSLDASLEKLEIQTYGVSITTLEEVFLAISHQEEQRNHELAVQASEPLELDDNFQLESVMVQGAFHVFWMHYQALFMKRINYFKRDKKGLVCEIFLPMLIVVFGLLILTI